MDAPNDGHRLPRLSASLDALERDLGEALHTLSAIMADSSDERLAFVLSSLSEALTHGRAASFKAATLAAQL